MADEKKQKLKALKHEGKPLKGTLKFPRLNEADYKFKKDTGEYSTKMIISAELAEAIKPQLEEAAEQAFAGAKAKLEQQIKEGKGEAKGKAKKSLADLKKSDLPIKPCYDDDGEETGEFELHFKMNASYTDKKGEKKLLSPDIFDTKGKKLKGKAIPQIWGGTVARVAADLQPWFMASENKAGVRLRLSGVQIIELKSGGGRDAAAHGFGAEEGYAADEDDMTTESTTEGDSESTEGGAGDGDEEF